MASRLDGVQKRLKAPEGIGQVMQDAHRVGVVEGSRPKRKLTQIGPNDLDSGVVAGHLAGHHRSFPQVDPYHHFGLEISAGEKMAAFAATSIQDQFASEELGLDRGDPIEELLVVEASVFPIPLPLLPEALGDPKANRVAVDQHLGHTVDDLIAAGTSRAFKQTFFQVVAFEVANEIVVTDGAD